MELFYSPDREVWRKWLRENFDKKSEVWFIFPMKESGEESMLYNDAVEEALCFGWIDSTIKHIDEVHRAQRFTPRRKGSPYSRPNVERLIWLNERSLLHEKVQNEVLPLISEEYVYPLDIIEEIKKDSSAWEYFQSFSEPYKRIRVAYIDASRDRPEEFEKRLNHFIERTAQGKLISGFGGIEKYYCLP